MLKKARTSAKRRNFFIEMSEHIKSRTPQQCRSHDQKAIRKLLNLPRREPRVHVIPAPKVEEEKKVVPPTRTSTRSVTKLPEQKPEEKKENPRPMNILQFKHIQPHPFMHIFPKFEMPNNLFIKSIEGPKEVMKPFDMRGKRIISDEEYARLIQSHILLEGLTSRIREQEMLKNFVPLHQSNHFPQQNSNSLTIPPVKLEQPELVPEQPVQAKVEAE